MDFDSQILPPTGNCDRSELDNLWALSLFAGTNESALHDDGVFSLGASPWSSGPSDSPDLITTCALPNNAPPSHNVSVSDHLSSLEGAYRPASPCAYCRRLRLQCIILRTTDANPNPVKACSSCVALFRECSLARGEKRQHSRFETSEPVIGQLHGVNEELNVLSDLAQIEESSTDISASARPPTNVLQTHGSKRVSSRITSRTKSLRLWFAEHQEFPYPSDDEKILLASESGLSKSQVINWFANARRRQKQRSNACPQQDTQFPNGSPMPQSFLSPSPDAMTPFERWRNSPPENEPILQSTIESALISGDHKSHDFNPFDLTSTIDEPLQPEFLTHRNLSTTSLDGFPVGSSTNSIASSSYTTSHSASSSVSLALSSSSKKWKPRPPKTSSRSKKPSSRQHPYQCTFCPMSFKKKFDWRRHEKSIHVPLESWICDPQKATQNAWRIGSASPECVFCGDPAPTDVHLASHDFESCAERPLAERSFKRKDHLWQHLDKFHKCKKWWPGWNINDFWQSVEDDRIRSHCGFCSAVLETWAERVDHLCKHFQQGRRMKEWVGDWGFDPELMRMVQHAQLPSDRNDGLDQARIDVGIQPEQDTTE